MRLVRLNECGPDGSGHFTPVWLNVDRVVILSSVSVKHGDAATCIELMDHDEIVVDGDMDSIAELLDPGSKLRFGR